MGHKWDALMDVYDQLLSDPRWKHLQRPGINLVPGDGPGSAESAKILLVGEAPGAEENGARRPFVGPSGQVLNSLLKSIRLARRDCFVTNVVKFRPPGNRTPTGREILDAIGTLRAEWRIIQPLLTIAVGSPAQSALGQRGAQFHGVAKPFGSVPGHWITSVYHPAFGLRRKQARIWIEEEWERLGRDLIEKGISL